LERNVDPSVALRQSLIYAISRIIVAFVWIYHGLVPKLLFEHHDEATMLLAGGLAPEHLTTVLRVIGLAEIAFGFALLAAWRARILLVLTIGIMIVAFAAVAVHTPEYLVAAFNPVTLNIAMIALSFIALLSGRDLPSAARCRRRRPEAG
jgi:uncharacterized membrane protein YphA (DoxX/SURF4 family)